MGPEAPTDTPPGATRPGARHRVGGAIALWGAMALAGVSLLSALAIWHLVRRGRLIRGRLGPPREVRLPAIDSAAAEPTSPEPPSP